MQSMNRVWALSIAMLAAGCGGAAVEQRSTALSSCTWDFSADVRQGASAPLSITGKIVIAEPQPGSIVAELRRPDGTVVPATGRFVNDKAIHLRFALPGGGVIEGMGPMPSAARCAGQLKGDLAGPGAGDRGDWLAISPVGGTSCFTTGPVCFTRERTNAECRDTFCALSYNLMPGETVQQCLSRCMSGDFSTLIYICGSNSGGVSTFFGSGTTTQCI